MKRTFLEISTNTKMAKSGTQNSYIGDPKLTPRVKQYINSCGSKPVLLSSMVDSLQQTYGEYRRKKRQAFVKSVEKAYNLIKSETVPKSKLEELEDKHLKKRKKELGDSESESESFSSENSYVEYKDPNSINSFMRDLYSKGTPKRQNDEQLISGWTIDKTPSSGALFGNTRKNVNTSSTSTFAKKQLQSDDFKVQGQELLNSTVDKLKSDTEKTPSKRLYDDSSTYNSAVSTPVPGNAVESDAPEKPIKSAKKNRTKTEIQKKKKEVDVEKSFITFADIGGNEATLKEVCKLLVHMKHPEVYQQLGVTPPRGFLLHGPPGCGKTLLAHAIAGELDQPFIKLAATEVVSGVSGESEEKIRDLFDKAVSCAPCILFLDEIDAITPKRETASKDLERRIVSQLLTCMDDLNNITGAHVLVIGATNRPDSLDPALRRAGRFDREISLGIPDERAREGILRVLCRNLRLEEAFDFSMLAKNSPGFVGADLTALAREAAMVAINRVFEDLQKDSFASNAKGATSQTVQETSQEAVSELVMEIEVIEADQSQLMQKTMNLTEHDSDSIIQPQNKLISVLSWLKDTPPLSIEQLQSLYMSMQDFQVALKNVQPSAKREGFATIPDVTWDDIGALHDVREELQMAILAPVRHHEHFKALGLSNPPGILLSGPPGCGKTLLAKAVANESGINFISVKGPELLNMYVGESERAVRQVFQRARNSSPCVIFFDELDSLCPKRSAVSDGGSSTRVVNQLLTEMDGLEERKQVFIMGATNRPDIIDPAILRPGRLDKIIYVGLPTSEDREDILKTLTKNGTSPKLTEDVNLHHIACDQRLDGFSGADLAALVRESAMTALKEYISTKEDGNPIVVNCSHFNTALQKVKPSVSKKDLAKYQSMRGNTGET